MTAPEKSRQFPFIEITGSTRDCGEQLGEHWRDAFHQFAAPNGIWHRGKPWWRESFYQKLINQFAPHLPDLFIAIARGAGLPEKAIGTRCLPAPDGCTSFAIHPAQTLEKTVLCGQTKDTPASRLNQYRILSLKPNDAPAMLTLTYPGWLFGHGFVAGGCAIFRNSLFTEPAQGRLSYAMWGLLALHCSHVEEAVDLAMRHGVVTAAHCTLTDCTGGIAGLEIAKDGPRQLFHENGIYVHTNHILSGAGLAPAEKIDRDYLADSKFRRQRLQESLTTNAPNLTPRLVFHALANHETYPHGLCNHATADYQTTAAVVAEPARGRLHVTCGPPCENAPITFSL